MKLFDVYPLFDIEPIKGQDCHVWDKAGKKYLDLYGGHAVISIGHSHPTYVERITQQLQQIGFYSNSVQNPLQKALAKKLGEVSNLPDYSLFLCNSGAEANENALKLASFYNKKKKVISFQKGFHGRTSGAVAITDNPKIVAPINENHESVILPLNDIKAVENELKGGEITAVIIEGILGIGGIHIPDPTFIKQLKALCDQYNAVLILDEIQSGYGRSGKFFAFEYANIQPDVITTAKGMGNGFPIGAVLISEKFQPWYGMLGTTFGGNYLACAAALAVLEVIEGEKLVDNAQKVGDYLIHELRSNFNIKEVRGAGLMIGMEFEQEIKSIRKDLLFKKCIFTGVSGTNTIRLLPPLTMTMEMADQFLSSLKETLQKK